MPESPPDNFVQTCMHTFQQYEYQVEKVVGKNVPWPFEVKKDDKKYAVYCLDEKATEEVLQQSSILDFISVAAKGNYRPVVICQECSDKDKESAESLGYCLLDMHIVQNFYEEMAHALEKEYGDPFLFDPLGGTWPMHIG